MPRQERIKKETTHHSKAEVVEETAVEKKIDTETIKSEMDDILDEIDSVLEVNAEEFVKGYIQKGGE